MNKVSFGEAAKFINGKAFKPSEWESSGLPIIRIQNLTGSSNVVNYYSGQVHKRHRIGNGDILISWSASLGVYLWNKGDAILNQHIFKVVPKSSVDKLYFYFAAQDALDAMAAEVHGTTMQHITKDRFEALEIPLPPPSEQRRIAAILDKSDRLRRLRRYALELSDTFLQSVFLQKFGDPVTNPMGWETKALEQIANIQRGKFTPRPRNDPRYYGGAHPFIQTGDISNSNGYLVNWTQTLNARGIKVSRAFNPGTIVIAIVGATIGETAILGIRTYCPDSVIGIDVDKEKSSSEFIEYLLRYWKPVFRARAPETARANINLKTLRPLPVIMPPLFKQMQFTRMVAKTRSLRSQQVEAIRQADHLFDALLHRTFRGGL